MKNIAAKEAELALQIERRQDLPPHDSRREAWRITIHRRDHEIGDLLAMVVPRSSVRQLRRDGLATCCPLGQSVSSSVEGIRTSTTGSRLQPWLRASCQARSI